MYNTTVIIFALANPTYHLPFKLLVNVLKLFLSVYIKASGHDTDIPMKTDSDSNNNNNGGKSCIGCLNLPVNSMDYARGFEVNSTGFGNKHQLWDPDTFS